jgi:hypothetical protein
MKRMGEAMDGTVGYLARRLGNDSFLKTAPTNSYAVMDEEGWRLSVDSGEKLDQEAQDRPGQSQILVSP